VACFLGSGAQAATEPLPPTEGPGDILESAREGEGESERTPSTSLSHARGLASSERLANGLAKPAASNPPAVIASFSALAPLPSSAALIRDSLQTRLAQFFLVSARPRAPASIS
jgi:hypothetical protein